MYTGFASRFRHQVPAWSGAELAFHRDLAGDDGEGEIALIVFAEDGCLVRIGGVVTDVYHGIACGL